MHTDLNPFAAATNNPFAAFLSPETVLAAHQRLATRVSGVVHRPLDKPRLVKAGHEALAAADAELDIDFDDDVDHVLDLGNDLSDIVSATFNPSI